MHLGVLGLESLFQTKGRVWRTRDPGPALQHSTVSWGSQHLHSLAEYRFQSWPLRLQSTCSWEVWWLQWACGLCHPCRESRRSFQHLTSARPSPGCCSHLEMNWWLKDQCPSLCFLKKNNKLFFFKKKRTKGLSYLFQFTSFKKIHFQEDIHEIHFSVIGNKGQCFKKKIKTKMMRNDLLKSYQLQETTAKSFGWGNHT